MYYQVFRWFPKSGFTRLMGWLAEKQWPPFLLRGFIRVYIRLFRVDMEACPLPLESFSTFNAFFSRPIRPELRMIDASRNTVVSPVDGRVSQAGVISYSELVQAKGHTYTVKALLAGDESWTNFEGGSYITIYLSPRDYHRIHSPVKGRVTRFYYVPGQLWTVSPAGVKGVPGLFARNERIITFVETDFGEVAVVKVGATVVGKVKVAYSPVETRIKGGRPFAQDLKRAYPVEKGQELGRFEMGSTVICLFPPGKVFLNPMAPDQALVMGQTIGVLGDNQ